MRGKEKTGNVRLLGAKETKRFLLPAIGVISVCRRC